MLSMNESSLIWIICLPMVVGFLLLAYGSRVNTYAKSISFLTTLVVFSLTIYIVALTAPELQERSLDPKTGQLTFKPLLVPGDVNLSVSAPTGRSNWDVIPLSPNSDKSSAIQFYVGVDGLNIWLVALISLLTPIIILACWNSIQDRIHLHLAWVLILQSFATCAFLALDVILFYFCFELTLLPAFFLIGNWGVGSRKREAARLFFLYTITGSLLTLIGILGFIFSISYFAGTAITFSIPQLMIDAQHLQSRLVQNPSHAENWLVLQSTFFCLLIVGFLIKIPLVPFHSWLPITYGEAPTSVVVFLSAILAKLGTYGIIRVVVPLSPEAMLHFGIYFLGTLCLISIIYGAFCAYAQSDMKQLIAYSSISHLGFCVLGIIALNELGITGAILHMVNHGLTTGALFLMTAMIFDRYQSRRISDYEGLANRLPNFTVYMMIFVLASVGLPGLNNFISELLILAGSLTLQNPHSPRLCYLFVSLALFGIILGSWYTLTLVRRILFGPLSEPRLTQSTTQTLTKDITVRELFVVLPLVSMCFVLGLFPQPFVSACRFEAQMIEKIYTDTRSRLYPSVSTTSPSNPTPTLPPAQRPGFRQPKVNP